MSASVADNYTYDLVSTFSVIRKKDYISEDKKNRISKIEVNPSGIICAITSIAIKAIVLFSVVLSFNPYVSMVLGMACSAVLTVTCLSTIREFI